MTRPAAVPDETKLAKATRNGRSDVTAPPALVTPIRKQTEPAEQTAWDAVDLLAEQFPEQVWAVTGLVPVGLTILSGAPKQGKSFMALCQCVAVALGVPFLGKPTNPGRVLYLALEDGARRAQNRLRMMPGYQNLRRGQLEIRIAAPRLDEGLLDDLNEWRTRSGLPPRLIIIDIFQRVRAAAAGKDRYAEDYAAGAAIQTWANRNGVAVILLHHNRKPIVGDDDPFLAVSGSTGLTGSVDAVMVLRGPRGAHEAALFISGRDVEQAEMSLEMNTGVWSVGAMPVDMITLTGRLRRDRDIWRYLHAVGKVPTEAIAKQFNLNAGAMVKVLRRIEETGWVAADGSPSPEHPLMWEALTEQDILDSAATPSPPMACVASVAPDAPVAPEAFLGR